MTCCIAKLDLVPLYIEAQNKATLIGRIVEVTLLVIRRVTAQPIGRWLGQSQVSNELNLIAYFAFHRALTWLSATSTQMEALKTSRKQIRHSE